MNSVANIWNHPKTSCIGLLIGLVSIGGVLSQQGVALGNAGSGTVVALVTGLASALLGLFAKDPDGKTSAAGSTAKLGAWALIALLLPLPFVGGCSGVTVAQDIVNWTPALQGAVATVDSTAALLAPMDAPVFAAATIGFDAASNLLVSQAKAYLANPSASLLAQLQIQIVTLQQQVNTALLQAVKIMNPASQQHALAAIQGMGAIVSAILALVQSISSNAALAQMAAASTIKMAAVRPYTNQRKTAEIVAGHYGVSAEWAQGKLAQAEQSEDRAGF